MVGGVVVGVKHYEVKITTLGPVHIGSGNTLGKKDYFIADRNTHILDPICFFKKLNQPQKNLYELFLERNYDNLTDFLAQNNLTSIAKTCISYSISGFKPEQVRNRNIYHDVSQFMRDGQGNPYIPGSSLKGVIRTLILGYSATQYPTRYIELVNPNARDHGSKHLEDKLFKIKSQHSFNSEEDDNLMRFISVSDSQPLSNDNLMFAKKFDLFSVNDSKKSEKSGNELNIYKECVKVGITISFRMDIDESKLKFESKKGTVVLTSVNLMNLVKNYYWYYKNHFLNHYDVNDDNIENVVYLGGGTGFSTKTINLQLFKENALKKNADILYKQFPTKISDEYKHAASLRREVRNAGFSPVYMNSNGRTKKNDHRHWLYKELMVSPHTLKCTHISNQIYQFGKCTIQIEELKSGG